MKKVCRLVFLLMLISGSICASPPLSIPYSIEVIRKIHNALSGEVYDYGTNCRKESLLRYFYSEKLKDLDFAESVSAIRKDSRFHKFVTTTARVINIYEESPVPLYRRGFWTLSSCVNCFRPISHMLDDFEVQDKRLSFLSEHLPLRELRRIAWYFPDGVSVLLRAVKASPYKLTDSQEKALLETAINSPNRQLPTEGLSDSEQPSIVHDLTLINLEALDADLVREIKALYAEHQKKGMFQVGYDEVQIMKMPKPPVFHTAGPTNFVLDQAGWFDNDEQYENQIKAFALLLHYGIIESGYFVNPADITTCVSPYYL